MLLTKRGYEVPPGKEYFLRSAEALSGFGTDKEIKMTEKNVGQEKPATHQQFSTELKNEQIQIIGKPQAIAVPVIAAGEKPDSRARSPLMVGFARGTESGIYCYVLEFVDPMKPETSTRIIAKRSDIFFKFDQIATTLLDHGCPITGQADIDGIRTALQSLAVVWTPNAPQAKPAEEKPAEEPAQK